MANLAEATKSFNERPKWMHVGIHDPKTFPNAPVRVEAERIGVTYRQSS